MSPTVATVVLGLGILGLFALDRDRKARTSKALWIPVIWLSIAASRMASQWLALTGLANVGTTIDAADQYLDGSPFDRFLLTGLLAIGLAVLVSRWRKLGPLVRSNGPLLLFFLYCGLSTLWSDYSDVAFKRWIKALGDLTMVLIVLTELDPSAAIKRFLARV